MFKRLFKYLMEDPYEEQNKVEDEVKNKVCITYCIDENDTPMVDVLLQDYDNESITALCSLLDILSQDAAYIETVKIIQENLILSGNEELFIKIIGHISQQENNKFTTQVEQEEENLNSQVCISPSEVIT